MLLFFLEKGYGLLVAKFKDFGLVALHFKITDYYRSLSHRDNLFIKLGHMLFPKFTRILDYSGPR